MSILAPESTSRADDPQGDARAWTGAPFPLGAHWDGAGVNFALLSEHATAVEVCLFARPDDPLRDRAHRSAGTHRPRLARLRPRSGAGSGLRLSRLRSISSRGRSALQSGQVAHRSLRACHPRATSTTPVRSMATIPVPDHAPTTIAAARAMMLPRCLAASSSIPRSIGEATHLPAFPGARPSSTRRTSRGSAASFRRSCRNCAAPISGSRTRRPSSICAIWG